jgi:FMN-dependent NADH-azoreductase
MNILHIDCSPRQESHSRELSAAIVKKLVEVAPDASISRRDLGVEPLPHTAADYAVALSTPATLAAPPTGSVDISEALIQEVEAADVIVIGTPMYNFSIPSTLKAWIDQILRVGRTMKSTSAGKVGMLRDRPVFIGVASGGVFTGDRANQPDFVTPYLTGTELHWTENPAIPSLTGHRVPRPRPGSGGEGGRSRRYRPDRHGRPSFGLWSVCKRSSIRAKASRPRRGRPAAGRDLCRAWRSGRGPCPFAHQATSRLR